jgi:predicted acylesterase/phospholipase RssA
VKINSQPPISRPKVPAKTPSPASTGSGDGYAGPTPPDDLGGGFVSVPPSKRGVGQKLHSFLAYTVSPLYNFGLSHLLSRISETTQKSVGVDVEGLLSVERTLYQTLASRTDAAHGTAPPVFQALADGQAAYVNLGPERTEDSDHLMRMFSGLPLETIEKLEIADPTIDKVRRHLVDQAKAKQFPIFVDMDNDVDSMSGTEYIATESIASIARRENSLGSAFPDPRRYYQWLLTRIDSNYKRLDPWLYAAQPQAHEAVVSIKGNLIPPWIERSNESDPFGSTPNPSKVQGAYQTFMKVAGQGQAPSWQTLTDVADVAVGLDRDLLSGIQTFWIKLLSEIDPKQRETVLAPVSRAWSRLITVGMNDPEFGLVSPENSPYIELVDRHNGKVILERYDRSLALSQAVDHAITGLGLTERRKFLGVLMGDIRSQETAILEREQRLRERLGDKYRGLDVSALLADKTDIHDENVRGALKELKEAAKSFYSVAPNGVSEKHEMTPEYAEIIRHRDLLDWVATRYTRYGDMAFNCLLDSPEYSRDPLILSAFYEPEVHPTGGVSPLPQASPSGAVWGKPVPGKEPMPVSIVLEGGGGKGRALVESFRQMEQYFRQGEGQIKVDEFVGNSAGAVTAGLLAAGYTSADLSDLLQKLDFKKFYADYLWLAGGVDPKARGINRNGIFSQQKMYKMLAELLKEKIPVQGRPVMFRDLPFSLKITSTAINTDLPPELLKQFDIGPEGVIVFSTDKTPNMDVAAAMSVSAAIPGFFDAPQIEISQSGPLREGERPEVHRMQLVDGAVTNNFPVNEAGEQGEKALLLSIPSYVEAPNPNGGPPISLNTLNFDATNIEVIDEHNRKRFSEFGPQLSQVVQKAQEGGYQRAVLALNLTRMNEQTQPVLQGRDRAATEDLLRLADQAKMPHMNAKDGARVVRENLESKERGFFETHSLNFLLDKNESMAVGWCRPTEFRLQKDEIVDVSDLVSSVLAANMTAPIHVERHLFEKTRPATES